MKPLEKPIFTHIMNVLTIALIIESFLCAMMLVNKFGRENCFDRIEEITVQTSEMFSHAMEENRNKLTVFADILAANNSNPEELLETYMSNFCQTQDFVAVCIHRANGTIVSHGSHPHEEASVGTFQEEVANLPYISPVYGKGDQPEDRYIYQAVPIVRKGETIAVLYGYITLDVFPSFITSTAYDGKSQFYIVDGDNGDFLLDEYHGKLGNIFDDNLGDRETKDGYEIGDMQSGVMNGESGYFVFKSAQTGEWYYTYYMPMDIKNWSMQLTIDEPTAFASYHKVNRTLMILAACVIVLMVIHVLVLMNQENNRNKKDKAALHKSNYINDVQRALINAQGDEEHMGQALKIIATELKAETALLLTFAERRIRDVQYWPSKDKTVADKLLNRPFREDFPTLYDRISAKEGIIYDVDAPALDLLESTKQILAELDVSNLMLVPIMDNSHVLKGAIAAVNMAEKPKSCDMLDCVTYDFFMAIANQENHAIIKRMGAMDYLTNLKNRNSYEAEIGSYATGNNQSLWCTFVDVNGLHEVNNTLGHKAGDIMLCAVADAVKRAFGEEHSYRLGGDEFVAFSLDSSKEECLRKKRTISAELAAKGYYVSVGFEGVEKNAEGGFDLGYVVSAAESIMYRDKQKFYRKNNIPLDRRHLPDPVGKH